MQLTSLVLFANGTVSAPAFPDASTTGPQAGTSFTTTSGEVRTSSNGQIIQNLDLTGYIIIQNNNVTIRDCIINFSDFFAILGNSGTGTVITRCKIIGSPSFTGINTENLNNIEISYCDISVCENGIAISSSDVNIHDNYIHALASGGAEPHIDGIQGFPGYTDAVINHNTIISEDTSGIISNGISPTTVTNNLFGHSGPISYGMQLSNSGPVTVTGNRIQISGGYPLFPFNLVSCTSITYNNNVNDATGETVNASIE